ncbi:ABC-F family ATP-binding cassette domain-containing protein [Pseudomonas sp. DSV-1]|uniref:ABC-F family ATP-binding cassette domain-containing protein n=1 Tax=Pseudomonas sp. DSV-1 TaxID=3112250 RepID=UPI002DB55FFA|nr:ABC-F family ATP-binding cassette domain-containing protein [Pseudomonas sp. DSV-1]MEC4241876.1 ABC-F family ATP-binding cassette domain-containing protein [Pseudomonas sp. DSV-1]
MTLVTSVTLKGVSFHLPDGSALFSDLDLHLDQRRTALVGRNGAGKSVLARLITGDIFPSTGHCTRNGTVYYLAQYVSPDPGHTVADLAGVQHIIRALEHIEQGSTEQADFDCIGERWGIRQQLLDQLAQNNLAHLTPSTPTSALSGGEAMRVALMGAFLSQADLLILDEPTNHLDRQHRDALHEQLQNWPNGLLVISHDRDLLEHMERIVELSSQGLISYGGGFSFYAQAKAEQLQAAQQQLASAKLERKRQEHAMREHKERLERSQSRGHKQASDANQANILLGRQKERSQASSGKQRVQQDAAREHLSALVRQAASQVEEQQPIFVYPPHACQSAPLQIAELIDARLPQGAEHLRTINLTLTRGQRIALVGANGCGKSTLLKVLAGQLSVISGQARTFVTTAYLDQDLGLLKPEQSVLEQLLSQNRQLNAGELRTRLAQLGLNADRVNQPCHRLSGGERLKAAMACVFYAASPPHLLLLDEPANHLDLPSVLALQDMLEQYSGTLIVTSHNEVFLAAIGVTHRLQASPTGWLNQPV